MHGHVELADHLDRVGFGVVSKGERLHDSDTHGEASVGLVWHGRKGPRYFTSTAETCAKSPGASASLTSL